MAYAALSTRPNVRSTEQLHKLIANGKCWHFDAWMLRHPSTGALFIRVQTRAGGREILRQSEYAVEHGRLRFVPLIPVECEPLTMQDQREWPRFDELNALHHSYVLPMAAHVPAGFHSRSVALHYVRAPSVAPFDGDVVNLHQYGE